jgi:hypothetical protein
MQTSKSAVGARYPAYTAILLVLTLGSLGAVHFGGLITLPVEVAAGILLTVFGLFTMGYLVSQANPTASSERPMYLVWGYVAAALGIALTVTPLVNLLLSLSLALVGFAIVALIVIRRG